MFTIHYGSLALILFFNNIIKLINNNNGNNVFINLTQKGAKVQVDMDIYSKSQLRYPFVAEMCENHLIAAVDFTKIYAEHKEEATHNHQTANSTSHSGNYSSFVKCL